MPIADAEYYITDPNRSRSKLSSLFLGLKFMFYPRIFWLLWKTSRRVVQRGIYSDDEFVKDSLSVLQKLESIGIRFEITGIGNLRKFDGPAVFIANHMSTLETFVLPCIIEPVKPITFVVKKSLVEMRIFGPIMRSRMPIVVGRTNPREDLRTVIEEGTKNLKSGKSIIVFPQGKRTVVFNPEEFNTLGIKLALKTGATVVPIALKTDAWSIGRFIPDFGPIDKKKKVYFAFGEPMSIKGRGSEEHERIIQFIKDKLQEWSKGDY